MIKSIWPVACEQKADSGFGLDFLSWSVAGVSLVNGSSPLVRFSLINSLDRNLRQASYRRFDEQEGIYRNNPATSPQWMLH